jgi:hypothetical protein
MLHNKSVRTRLVLAGVLAALALVGGLPAPAAAQGRWQAPESGWAGQRFVQWPPVAYNNFVRPIDRVALNPQPLPPRVWNNVGRSFVNPGLRQFLNPQPLPPGGSLQGAVWIGR